MSREEPTELAQRRITLGHTQNSLAREMGDEVTAQAISKWENGAAMPSGNNLLLYARLLKMKPAEVLEMIARAREAREREGASA